MLCRCQLAFTPTIRLLKSGIKCSPRGARFSVDNRRRTGGRGHPRVPPHWSLWGSPAAELFARRFRYSNYLDLVRFYSL